MPSKRQEPKSWCHGQTVPSTAHFMLILVW